MGEEGRGAGEAEVDAVLGATVKEVEESEVITALVNSVGHLTREVRTISTSSFERRGVNGLFCDDTNLLHRAIMK